MGKMKLLHYSLGFPPYRTGGLTKFCMDLMSQQTKDGHIVSLLWPGEIRKKMGKTRIRKHNSVVGIESYEIINPTPISYDEGIKDFKYFTSQGNRKAYEELLNIVNPDIIHIHTLMGLHKAFLDVAKEKKIRIVFTAHDFFPICPKVTLFRNGGICCSIKTCDECGICNNTALSLNKIKILQSPLYRGLKDNKIVKKLRKRHRDEFLGEKIDINETSVGTADDFKALREYYYSLLKMMDAIHYNSSITRKVYENVFKLERFVQIPITHSDIKNHKKTRVFNNEKLRIRYLGPQSNGKGFAILKNSVEKLWLEEKKISLDVHFFMENKPDFINCHDRFCSDDLESIFENTDIMVCPSIWYETFGYTVLEALSYGVPVIVSDSVGAKDIITDGAGIIIRDINEENLYEELKTLNSRKLALMNKKIVEEQEIITMVDMTKILNKQLYLID